MAHSLIQKALENKLIDIETVNFRKFGFGKQLKVDDTPYGGGAGMVLRPEPIIQALEECEKTVPGHKTHRVLVSPQGTPFTQAKAKELSALTLPIALICGRFEGFDERVRSYTDEEISIGDYVLLGGEVAAMVIIEAVSRLVPGVIGNPESLRIESFNKHLLEHAQYTKPIEFRGDKVPEVLVSGNHQKIDSWRKESAITKTRAKRKDLSD